MPDTPTCLGDELTGKWWRDPEKLAHEVSAHGGKSQAARAHDLKVSLLNNAWQDLGMPSLPSGAPSSSPRRAKAGSVVTREEILEQEVRELRRQVGEARKAEVFQERALELLADELDRVHPSYKTPKWAKVPGKTEHEFLLAWSDLHAAEVVSGEQTNGLNSYDWNEMVERHWRLTKSIYSFKRNRPYPVNKLTIAPLGDMVSGDIHDELRETNEKVLMEAAVSLGCFAADWIADSFASEFAEVVVDGCVTGNHARRSKKPQAKNVHDSFDWLVYEIIRVRLENLPNVTVRVPKAAHAFIEVAGRRIMCFHGDGVRSTMVGVPWGGIIRQSQVLQKQYEALGKIDHFLLGHWHEPNVVSNKRIIVNGSMKGPDEYGLSRGLSSPATQLLIPFHPERGMTEVCYLDLQP